MHLLPFITLYSLLLYPVSSISLFRFYPVLCSYHTHSLEVCPVCSVFTFCLVCSSLFPHITQEHQLVQYCYVQNKQQQNLAHIHFRKKCLSIYPVFLTAVVVFRKPNAIPLCFSIDLVLNFLLSWLLVLLPSMFFLVVFFSFSPMVSNP